MQTFALIVVLVIVAGIAAYQWQRFRAFRAEVVIECLRLWREQIEGFYVRHPDKTPVTSIAEEAMFSAMHSEHRHVVYSKAWANVKRRRSSPSD